MQDAFEADVARMRDAWRDPPTYQLPRHDAAPAGAYPIGVTSKAGDACTINGAPSVLVEEDGMLVCRATELGASRSGADVPGRDSRTSGMSDAQSTAWRQMVDDLFNSWKNPR